MVPFSAFTQSRWITGPVQLVRFNGYPAMKVQGDAAPGASSGDALAEVKVEASFKLNRQTAQAWVDADFAKPGSGRR